MLSLWILCSVVWCMLSYAFAFTLPADYQSTSSLGPRTAARINKKNQNSKFGSRAAVNRCARGFSRNAALQMATELKFSDDENGMTNSTTELTTRVETVFPRAEILTITMDDHVPLGCTVEESLHEDDDSIFISKLTKGGNAEHAGLKLGDVIVGVTGLFGDIVSTIESDVEKIKRLVAAVSEEVPLSIQVARGTDVFERHESTINDVCMGAGASEKEVQECVVDFLSGGYNYDDDVVENDSTECEADDSECLIDDMMNLWADELPPPSTTTGITAQTVQKTSKPKPWSVRSSGSGTYVRDPKTGKMRNIDA